MTVRDLSIDLILERIATGEGVTLGRYELTRLVGSGGMGHVFEAWDSQLERRIAIKFLRGGHSDELALREARCLARVTDPHVVSVHEVGRLGGLAFIAMELIDGPDLRQWLRERGRRWDEILDRITEAGRGLAAVHHAGLVHGDVKPANMIVGRDGHVRLADFGLAWASYRGRRQEEPAAADLAVLARLVADSIEQEFVTQGLARGHDAAAPADVPQPAGGTWTYMAPECLEGACEHTPRTDQYSLCATAWEALFGVRPYAGDSAEALLASVALGHLERGGGRPRGMPRALVAVLARGLHEDEAQRWPDVDALLDAVSRARESRLAKRLVGAALQASICVAIAAGIGGVLRCSSAEAEQPAAIAAPGQPGRDVPK